MARRREKKLGEEVFEKTLAVFSDLLGRDLDLIFEDQIVAATNGKRIQIPRKIPEAGIHFLNYDIYCLMNHELAHIVFNSDFGVFGDFRKSKGDDLKQFAAHIWNLVDDVRIESCWNMIYKTPFDTIGRKLFIYPNIGKKQKLTPLDVAMDVDVGYIRTTDDEYLKMWKEIKTILDEVKENVYCRATTRVAEKLFNYLLNKMKDQKYLSKGCRLSEDSDERRMINFRGRKKLEEIVIDPNLDQTCNSCNMDDLSPEDMKTFSDAVRKYRSFVKTPNTRPDDQNRKIKVPDLDNKAGAEKEKMMSKNYIDDIRRIIVPEEEEVNPEDLVIGEIDFQRFPRCKPTNINRSARGVLPIKYRTQRWYCDIGEFDPDEYLQRKIRQDWHDIDYFEEQRNVIGMDIIFLVDYSSSMAYGRKEFDLKQSVYTLWQSVAEVPGVNVETIIYSGGRTGVTPIEIIENPEELLEIRPSGSTHTYRALDYVYRKLHGKKNHERIVILLTDGEPTCDGIINRPYAYVKAVIERMREDYMNILTLFIDSREVTDEKLRYFGDKSNCFQIDSDNIIGCLSKEVGRFIQSYVKCF